MSATALIDCIGPRSQVHELLGKLASHGAVFNSYDEVFLAQPTPVDDELHMMAACLAYFKVRFSNL